MFLFLLVVLPLLCLFSLVMGMIYAYRKNQADGEEHIRNGTDQMAIEKIEEASEVRKDIIYVSLCCACVLLFLSVCYFAVRNSAIEPIDYSEQFQAFYGSGMVIIFVGAFTLVLMIIMLHVGFLIAFMMSLDSFMRFCGRFLSSLIMFILFILLMSVFLG